MLANFIFCKISYSILLNLKQPSKTKWKKIANQFLNKIFLNIEVLFSFISTKPNRN